MYGLKINKKYTIILNFIDNQRILKVIINENVIRNKKYFIQINEYSDKWIIITGIIY